jgi:vancomycin resistance protein YoaR
MFLILIYTSDRERVSVEGKKPIEEQLPEGKKDAAEELQSPAGQESDERKAASPECDAEVKQATPKDVEVEQTPEVTGDETAFQPAAKDEEKPAEAKEIDRDRAFDTMELKIFGQWDTENKATPILEQSQESTPEAQEIKPDQPGETTQAVTAEEPVQQVEEEKPENDAPVAEAPKAETAPKQEPHTLASVKVDFSEEIANLEKEESKKAEEKRQPEPAPADAAATVTDDTGVFKSVKREIRTTPRPKKLLVMGIVSSMVIAGVVGFSAFAYEQQTSAGTNNLRAEQPVQKPNYFELTLDGQSFKLDLNTIGYDGKNENTIDQHQLRTWLDSVQKKVNVEPKNAKASRIGGKITPEQDGRKVDVKKVEEWLKNLKPLINKPQPIPMVTLKPLVTTQDIKNVDKKLIGKYGTKFDPGNVNRTTNMRLASKAISGIILMPGEKFSFNQVVGERTTARGYKTAGVIVKGEFTEGIGGGICQVSSTLYNSVDEAGLKMLQVNHHSAEVTYVPKGRDATVSWGGPDFKFRNNLNKPVMIKIKMAGPYLTVYTYTAPGAKVTKKKVQAPPETFTQVKVNPTQQTEPSSKTGN